MTEINNYSIENNLNTSNTDSRLETIKNMKNSEEKNKLAAKEFESFFISMMFKEMRKTVTEGGLIPKTQAEKIFEELLDQKYSEKMAEKGGLGLSELLLEKIGHKITSTDKSVDII